jgi:hypothetical protein
MLAVLRGEVHAEHRELIAQTDALLQCSLPLAGQQIQHGARILIVVGLADQAIPSTANWAGGESVL